MGNQIFSRNLAAELERRGMTRKQLAIKSGVSESHIGKFIRGVDGPSIKNAQKIANALNLPLDTLLTEHSSDHST